MTWMTFVFNIDQSLMLQSDVNGWDADPTWIALTKDSTQNNLWVDLPKKEMTRHVSLNP